MVHMRSFTLKKIFPDKNCCYNLSGSIESAFLNHRIVFGFDLLEIGGLVMSELKQEEYKFMQRAIDLALLAEGEGNLPIGAVITMHGKILAEGRNKIWVPEFDATKHAEMNAIRGTSKQYWKFSEAMSIYTTLEPCLMCFSAIILHRIGRVVYGASDSYGGASSVFSQLPPFFKGQLQQTQWIGPVMQKECTPLSKRVLELEGVSL
jgi:tRNA(adenine34) deaminase